jgi:hypothetical protein
MSECFLETADGDGQIADGQETPSATAGSGDFKIL